METTSEEKLIWGLQGKKTYIAAGGLALASFARSMGWVDESTFLAIMGFLNAMGLTALRAGIAKK